jgi:hypothetical protein
MKTLSLVFLILMYFPVILFGQNLIQNSSFEYHISCPSDIVNFNNNLPHWYNPTLTTPDYFNSCNNSSNGIPENFAGTMAAKTGTGYVGIVTYWHDDVSKPSDKRWREYIQTSLQLELGIKYQIEFYVARASKMKWETKIQALITNEQITQQNILPIIQTPTYSSGSHISETTQWSRQKFSYTASATGTYYLTIGLFDVNDSARVVGSTGFNMAYYFIDDVKVTAQGCCPTNLTVTKAPSSPQTFAATNSISVGSFTLAPGANVTFIAGNEIVFSPSFQGTDFVAQIGPCPSSLQQKSVDIFPNIVTPNGDGFEDAVCLNLFGGTHYVSEIFNRWGTLVYAKSGPINTAPICIWDGSCNQCSNPKLPDGVYFAVLKIKGCEFRDTTFSQEIHLFNNPYSGLAPQNDTILAEERKDDFFDDRTDWVNPAPEEEIILGVGSKDVTHQFQVYPNPSTGLVNISLPPFSTRSHLQIFDGSGNSIYEKDAIPASKINIDLSEYAKGVYYIRVINEAKVFLNRFILK